MKKNKLDKSEIKKYWDNNIYDNYLRSGGPPTLEALSVLRHHIEMRRFTKHIPLNKGYFFLELGCGSGRYAVDIAKKVKKVVAVDLSTMQIRQLNKVIKENNIKNITTICGDMTKVKLNGKYDVIFLSGVTQYIEDDELSKFLKYLKSKLNDHGIIISRDSINLVKTVYVSGSYPCKYRNMNNFLKVFNSSELKKIQQFSAYSFVADGLFKSSLLKPFRNILLNAKFYSILESLFIKFDRQLLTLMAGIKGTKVDAEHVFTVWVAL